MTWDSLWLVAGHFVLLKHSSLDATSSHHSNFNIYNNNDINNDNSQGNLCSCKAFLLLDKESFKTPSTLMFSVPHAIAQWLVEYSS